MIQRFFLWFLKFLKKIAVQRKFIENSKKFLWFKDPKNFFEFSLIQRNFLWIKENLWFKEKVFEFDQNSKKIQRKNEAKNRKKIFKEKVFESKKIQRKFKEISLIQRYLWKQGEANTFVPNYPNPNKINTFLKLIHFHNYFKLTTHARAARV